MWIQVKDLSALKLRPSTILDPPPTPPSRWWQNGSWFRLHLSSWVRAHPAGIWLCLWFHFGAVKFVCLTFSTLLHIFNNFVQEEYNLPPSRHPLNLQEYPPSLGKSTGFLSGWTHWLYNWRGRGTRRGQHPILLCQFPLLSMVIPHYNSLLC